MNTKVSKDIKFRAWCEKDQMMYMNIKNGIQFEDGSKYTFDKFLTNGSDDYHQWRVMQFTGLKDKDNKEIYEGDIVKWDDGSDGRYWRVAVVYWDEDECLYCFRCVKNTLHPLSTEDGYVFGSNFMNRRKANAADELIKVGNIHQNSYLLSQGGDKTELL